MSGGTNGVGPLSSRQFCNAMGEIEKKKKTSKH